MKKNKKKLIAIASVAAIVIITNLLTFIITATSTIVIGDKVLIDTNSSTSAQNLSKMAQLEELLVEDYYEEVDEQDLWDAAFKGLFSGTGDSYSTYYTEEEYSSYTSGYESSYSGIGVQIRNDSDNQVIVDSVFQGTPAEQAGVKAGDIIIKIDDTDSTSMDISTASSLIRGEEGTTVTIVVLRDSEEKEFTITRASVDLEYVSGEMIDDYGYIQITQFAEDVATDFESYYDSFTEKGMKGLIIDLRSNPGGLVDEATGIAEILLPEGSTIISTTNKDGESGTTTDTTSECASIPVVVLIDGSSASSSEILTCALQDNEVATVIGEKSYGKGIIQEVKSLSDGSGVTITIDEYLSPNGSKIHGEGITPDIEVELDSDSAISELEQSEDNQLQEAITYLNEKTQ